MPIYRSQSWGQRVILKSGGVAMNLTGISLRMQFRRTPEAAIALVELSTVNGKMVVSAPTAGQIDLALSEIDTENLTLGQIYWDIIRTDTKQRLTGGYALVEQGVTR